MKVFLTGPPGIGKSTVLQRVDRALRAKGHKVGGVYCPEIREGRTRIGFEIVDVASGQRGILSKVGSHGKSRVGKYVVNLEDLTRIGVNALDSAAREADIILIDEIGPMEMQGIDFQKAVLNVVDGPKPVVGIIHWRMQHPVIVTIKGRSDVIVLEVSIQNREELQDEILRELSKTLKKAMF